MVRCESEKPWLVGFVDMSLDPGVFLCNPVITATKTQNEIVRINVLRRTPSLFCSESIKSDVTTCPLVVELALGAKWNRS
jgi:hypothetical protein